MFIGNTHKILGSQMSTADRDVIVQQVREELQAEYTRKLADEVLKIQSANKKMMEEAIADWQDKQKPPTNQEIEKLLSQEYITFTVKVREKGKDRDFSISELPQAIEKKFYKKFKDKLIPNISGVAELTVNIAEGLVEKKLTTILEMFEPAIDILAEATLIVLNPYDEDKDIDLKWVQDNIPSFRQWNIVLAQERVNRLRDFFFQASAASQGPTGMRGVGIQQ